MLNRIVITSLCFFFLSACGADSDGNVEEQDKTRIEEMLDLEFDDHDYSAVGIKVDIPVKTVSLIPVDAHFISGPSRVMADNGDRVFSGAETGLTIFSLNTNGLFDSVITEHSGLPGNYLANIKMMPPYYGGQSVTNIQVYTLTEQGFEPYYEYSPSPRQMSYSNFEVMQSCFYWVIRSESGRDSTIESWCPNQNTSHPNLAYHYPQWVQKIQVINDQYLAVSGDGPEKGFYLNLFRPEDGLLTLLDQKKLKEVGGGLDFAYHDGLLFFHTSDEVVYFDIRQGKLDNMRLLHNTYPDIDGYHLTEAPGGVILVNNRQVYRYFFEGQKPVRVVTAELQNSADTVHVFKDWVLINLDDPPMPDQAGVQELQVFLLSDLE